MYLIIVSLLTWNDTDGAGLLVVLLVVVVLGVVLVLHAGCSSSPLTTETDLPQPSRLTSSSNTKNSLLYFILLQNNLRLSITIIMRWCTDNYYLHKLFILLISRRGESIISCIVRIFPEQFPLLRPPQCSLDQLVSIIPSYSLLDSRLENISDKCQYQTAGYIISRDIFVSLSHHSFDKRINKYF